jgi:hypothetical protein
MRWRASWPWPAGERKSDAVLNLYHKHFNKCPHRAKGQTRSGPARSGCTTEVNGKHVRKSVGLRDWIRAVKRIEKWQEKPQESIRLPTMRESIESNLRDCRAESESLHRRKLRKDVRAPGSFLPQWRRHSRRWIDLSLLTDFRLAVSCPQNLGTKHRGRSSRPPAQRAGDAAGILRVRQEAGLDSGEPRQGIRPAARRGATDAAFRAPRSREDPCGSSKMTTLTPGNACGRGRVPGDALLGNADLGHDSAEAVGCRLGKRQAAVAHHEDRRAAVRSLGSTGDWGAARAPSGA